MTDPQKIKILLLEDAGLDADLIIEKLNQDEPGVYDTLHVRTKSEFLDQLEAFQPDVILSDYDLHRYDGFQALDDAQSVDEGIPFIIVTGTLSEELAADSIKSGASDYVIKDRLERLPVAVKNALERKEERDRRNRAEQMLQVLNQAALATVQAVTVEEVFAVAAEELRGSGFSSVVFIVDENRQNLTPRHLSYRSKALESAQKLTGLRIEEFSMPIDTTSLFARVIRDRETVFVANLKEAIEDFFPKRLRPFAGKLVDIFGVYRSIDAPLIVEDEVLGVLSVQADDLREADRPAVTAFAHQIAAAWRKALLYEQAKREVAERRRAEEETRRRVQQLSFINEMGQRVVSSLDVARALADVVDSIPNLIEAEGVSVLLLEGDRLVFKAASGEHGDELVGTSMPADIGVAGKVLQCGDSLLVGNGDGQGQIYRDVDAATGFVTESLVAVPILLGGETIGVIEAVHSTPDAFDRGNLDVLETAATWVAIAIGNARQHAAIQRRLQESEAFASISMALNKTMDLNKILQLIVDSADEIIPNVQRAVIHILSEENGHMLVPTAVAGPVQKTSPKFSMHPGEGVAGQVIASGETINVRDTEQDPNFIPAKTDNPIRSLLVAPIQREDHRLGTISLISLTQNAFSSDDEQLLTLLGVEAALAIENAQLLELERRRRREAETLRRITNTLTSTLNLDDVLDTILEELANVLSHDGASILLWEREHLRAVACRDLPHPELVLNHTFPADSSLFVELVATKKPILLADAQADPRFEAWAETTYVRSWMGVPLISHQQVIGYIALDHRSVGAYTPADTDMAQAFANQAATAIENARLFTAMQRRLHEINTLYFISNQIVVSPEVDVDDILKSVVNMLQKNFGYYHVHCYLFDTESDSLIMQQGSGSIGRELKERGHHLEPGEGIVGYVATLGETYMTNSVDDTVFYRANPLLPETEAELAAPLRVREETLGVLDVQHQAPDSFDEEDLRFISAIADQLAVVLDKAMIYTELQNALAKEQAARTQLVQTETLTAMGRLVASVAHELNNPLQAIRSALYLIQTEDELSGQSARDLQVAIDETKRMAGLIGRLRETSRPVEDTEFERDHLNTLVHEVEKLIATHLRHNEIDLVFNTEANLPPLPVIRDRIKQVILNLCINAIESMPSGGTITIATAYLEEEGMVKLSVSDTGPGIEPDVLPRLFEPFFTTKEQGTGLGLYISYDIAQHHQGQLDVHSEVGSGTTFELLLPLERS